MIRRVLLVDDDIGPHGAKDLEHQNGKGAGGMIDFVDE